MDFGILFLHVLQTFISYLLKAKKRTTTNKIVPIKNPKAVYVLTLQNTINSNNKNKVTPKANNLTTNCIISILLIKNKIFLIKYIIIITF